MDRILLKFSENQINQPIISQVILELKISLNILTAEVTSHGGLILIDVSSKDINRVVKAFQEKGVTVTFQKRIVVNEELCFDCGACYSLCPVEAIGFDKDYSVVFDEEKCISCDLCIDTCPTRAISI